MKLKNLDPIGLILLFVVGFALIVVVIINNDSKQAEVAQSSPKAATIATREPTATLAPGETPVPTPEPAPQPTGVATGDRIVIGKANIDAPLSFKSAYVDKENKKCVMPNPDGADDVAIYSFAACEGNYGGTPGKGPNTILSGHVDSGRSPCKNGKVPPPCTAVFWELGTLSINDVITIEYDGITYRYAVTSNQPVHAENGDWDSIAGDQPGSEETITLITCGGDFNTVTREYSHRQVVVAKRIQ